LESPPVRLIASAQGSSAEAVWSLEGAVKARQTSHPSRWQVDDHCPALPLSDLDWLQKQLASLKELERTIMARIDKANAMEIEVPFGYEDLVQFE